MHTSKSFYLHFEMFVLIDNFVEYFTRKNSERTIL